MVINTIVSHFEIFACALPNQLNVIAKAHILQLYKLEMFVNPFIL